MTVVETVLVFVGIPLGVAGLVAVLVYSAGVRRLPRYRPGRPFEVAPVWFLASPPADPAADPAAPTAGDPARPAVTAGPGSGPKGGARGSW